MKLTKQQLKQIIKEELEKVFLEEGWKDIALAGLMGVSSMAAPQATAAQPPVATQAQAAEPTASSPWEVPSNWVGKTGRDEKDMNKYVRGKIWYKGAASRALSPDGKVEMNWIAAYDMIMLSGEDTTTGEVLFEIIVVEK